MKTDEKVPTVSQSALLKIRRFDPEVDAAPWVQAYDVTVGEKMTVLDALFEVLWNQDPSLCFRYSCRAGMCGTCTMVINGRERLACRTQLAEMGPEVGVEPLHNLPVLKDLMVDMEPFFEKYRRAMPYFVPRAGLDEPAVIRPDSGLREIADEQLECIDCGACYSACTLAAVAKNFLGPAALNRAYVLIADPRDGAHEERLAAVGGKDGAFRCHTLFNCAEVCPKHLSPTRAIQQLKRKSVRREVSRLASRVWGPASRVWRLASRIAGRRPQTPDPRPQTRV